MMCILGHTSFYKNLIQHIYIKHNIYIFFYKYYDFESWIYIFLDFLQSPSVKKDI